MSLLDDILTQHNLKYDDLTVDEKTSLNEMLDSIQRTKLTPEKLQNYIISMRQSVEAELAKVGYGSKEDIFLKARLRNYMLLEAFLDSPKKAQAALEAALSGVVGGKK